MWVHHLATKRQETLKELVMEVCINAVQIRSQIHVKLLRLTTAVSTFYIACEEVTVAGAFVCLVKRSDKAAEGLGLGNVWELTCFGVSVFRFMTDN